MRSCVTQQSLAKPICFKSLYAQQIIHMKKAEAVCWQAYYCNVATCVISKRNICYVMIVSHASYVHFSIVHVAISIGAMEPMVK